MVSIEHAQASCYFIYDKVIFPKEHKNVILSQYCRYSHVNETNLGNYFSRNN